MNKEELFNRCDTAFKAMYEKGLSLGQQEVRRQFYYGFYEALTLAGLEDEYLDWRIARTAGKSTATQQGGIEID